VGERKQKAKALRLGVRLTQSTNPIHTGHVGHAGTELRNEMFCWVWMDFRAKECAGDVYRRPPRITRRERRVQDVCSPSPSLQLFLGRIARGYRLNCWLYKRTEVWANTAHKNQGCARTGRKYSTVV
jgi:hypothetical protein